MTLHDEEEMDNDGLSIFEVERCILAGEITERQKDSEAKEWKYVIKGQSIAGDKADRFVKSLEFSLESKTE